MYTAVYVCISMGACPSPSPRLADFTEYIQHNDWGEKGLCMHMRANRGHDEEEMAVSRVGKQTTDSK